MTKIQPKCVYRYPAVCMFETGDFCRCLQSETCSLKLVIFIDVNSAKLVIFTDVRSAKHVL